MLATRWSPFSNLWSEMDRLQREMNQLFSDWGVDQTGWRSLATTYPALNIWEDADHLYVEAELPGLKLEDLVIHVTQGNQLSIQGERRPCGPEKGVWHRQERGFGKFARTVTLPIPVDADKVVARFEHGVLSLTLPKSEAAKPRRIPVKAE
jgi:HSP20 family protein